MPASRPFPHTRRSRIEFRAHERGRIASTTHLLLHGNRIVEARAVDISAGGLRLVAPVNLPLRATCGVRLLVPAIPSGTHTVMARAQVVNIVFSGKENGFVAGLRFTALSHPSRVAIEAYLHDRLTHTRHRTPMPRRRPAATLPPLRDDDNASPTE